MNAKMNRKEQDVDIKVTNDLINKVLLKSKTK